MEMTVKSMWLTYKEIIPKTAPPEQITETRRAFYAGVFGVLTLELMVASGMPEKEAAEAMGGWLKECRKFKDSVENGTEGQDEV